MDAELKLSIKRNLKKYVSRFKKQKSMGVQEIAYFFEEALNSKVAFKARGKVAGHALIFLTNGFFELIPNDQKFLEHSKGVIFSQDKTINELLKMWEGGKLNESDSYIFFYRLILNKRTDIIENNWFVAKHCIQLISMNYLTCLANERTIQAVLKNSK